MGNYIVSTIVMRYTLLSNLITATFANSALLLLCYTDYFRKQEGATYTFSLHGSKLNCFTQTEVFSLVRNVSQLNKIKSKIRYILLPEHKVCNFCSQYTGLY